MAFQLRKPEEMGQNGKKWLTGDKHKHTTNYTYLFIFYFFFILFSLSPKHTQMASVDVQIGTAFDSLVIFSFF
jgi:hypothetical protein